LSARGSTADAANSNNPFQLDHLAEELVTHEHIASYTRAAFSPPTHDLPLYIPLSHSNPHLTAPTFLVKDFLLSHSHTSLPDICSKLRELVKLII
jgi:hypothetical protein